MRSSAAGTRGLRGCLRARQRRRRWPGCGLRSMCAACYRPSRCQRWSWPGRRMSSNRCSTPAIWPSTSLVRSTSSSRIPTCCTSCQDRLSRSSAESSAASTAAPSPLRGGEGEPLKSRLPERRHDGQDRKPRTTAQTTGRWPGSSRSGCQVLPRAASLAPDPGFQEFNPWPAPAARTSAGVWRRGAAPRLTQRPQPHDPVGGVGAQCGQDGPFVEA